MNKKKFKDTKVGLFIQKKLPDVIEIIGDNLPIPHVLTNMITSLIKPEDKVEFDSAMQEYTQVDYDFLLAQEKEITERWKADMASDSWLSKNVRPLTVLILLGIVLALSVLDSMQIGFSVKIGWVDLYTQLLIVTFVAYFGSRGFEKVTEIRNKK